MADPRNMSVKSALAILHRVSSLQSVSNASDEYKRISIDLLRRVYLDHPTPTMGSLDKLFATIDKVQKVQDLEMMMALRIGVAETVIKAGAYFKASKGRDLKMMSRNFQIFAWWCQTYLDVESLCTGAGYKDAA